MVGTHAKWDLPLHLHGVGGNEIDHADRDWTTPFPCTLNSVKIDGQSPSILGLGGCAGSMPRRIWQARDLLRKAYCKISSSQLVPEVVIHYTAASFNNIP